MPLTAFLAAGAASEPISNAMSNPKKIRKILATQDLALAPVRTRFERNEIVFLNRLSGMRRLGHSLIPLSTIIRDLDLVGVPILPI